jgi:hypothetical protein
MKAGHAGQPVGQELELTDRSQDIGRYGKDDVVVFHHGLQDEVQIILDLAVMLRIQAAIASHARFERKIRQAQDRDTVDLRLKRDLFREHLAIPQTTVGTDDQQQRRIQKRPP